MLHTTQRARCAGVGSAAKRCVLRPMAAVRHLCVNPGIRDNFALLQTERSFTLDADALQVAYKRLMAEAHPDRHGQASPEQQQLP